MQGNRTAAGSLRMLQTWKYNLLSRGLRSTSILLLPLPPFQRDVRKGLQFRRQRRWSAHSRAHKGLSALAYSLRTKYTAATSILRTAHDLLPIGFVAQSDRMLVELIQRSGLQSKPGSKTFSSIPGLSYFPFLNHWWSFSLFSSQKTQFRVLRGLHTLVKSN